MKSCEQSGRPKKIGFGILIKSELHEGLYSTTKVNPSQNDCHASMVLLGIEILWLGDVDPELSKIVCGGACV